MEFIKKLLGRGEAPEMVSRAEYDALKQHYNDQLKWWSDSCKGWMGKCDAARAEAAANAAELAQWRQYGQMRDPATGRLIPRVKAEVA